MARSKAEKKGGGRVLVVTAGTPIVVTASNPLKITSTPVKYDDVQIDGGDIYVQAPNASVTFNRLEKVS